MASFHRSRPCPGAQCSSPVTVSLTAALPGSLRPAAVPDDSAAAPPNGLVVSESATSAGCDCTIIAEHGRRQAYSQEAFHYFLQIEQKRSQLTGRPFLLLLVDRRKTPGIRVRLDPAAANQVLSGLLCCLRETDIVGWYRRGRVVGALLTDFDRSLLPASSPRVSHVLDTRVTSTVVRQFHVRAYHSSVLSGTDSRRPVLRASRLPEKF